MNFGDAFDFWMENVLFGAFTLTFKFLDVVADGMGDFAAFITYVLLIPLWIFGLVAGVLLTGVMLVLMLVTAPITLPVTIYLHRRKRS